MYGVFTRKTLFALLVILIVVLILMGVAGNVMGVSAAPRELPIYSVETPEKVLSLGINCAWDDSDIDEILKLLDERGVKATFFVVGTWADHYPDAVRRIAAAGHEVGSHSNTHPDMTKLGREEIAQQLDASGSKLEALTGQRPVLFRAPSGAYNNLVVSTARALGWEVIQWSNDSLDWKGLSVEEITARVAAPPGRGTSCSSTRASPTRPRRSAGSSTRSPRRATALRRWGSSSTGRPIRSTTRAGNTNRI